MRLPLRPLIGLLVSLTSASLGAEPSQIAAHLVRLDSVQTRQIDLRRAGHFIVASFDLPLVAGDELSVQGVEGSVGIHYVDGRDHDVTPLTSPYRVQASAKPKIWLENYAALLWSLVTKHHDEGLATTVVRGKEDDTALALLIPGLATGKAQLPAGTAPFVVGWQGGAPPFRVLLTRTSGEKVADQADLLARRLITARHPVTLTPGRYALEIDDAAGVSVRGSFNVTATVPLSPSDTADTFQTTDTAASRLQQAGAGASFATYQTLAAPLLAHWEPADALAKWLEAGAPGS